MKTRDIDITEYFDEETMSGEPLIVIKKLRFGEFNDIQDEVTNVTVRGKNNVSASPKIGQMKFLLVLRSIMKAPFNFNDVGTVRDLDLELGEMIYDEVEDLNNLGEAEDEDFPNE